MKFKNSPVSFQDLANQKPLRDLSDSMLYMKRGTEKQIPTGTKVTLNDYAPCRCDEVLTIVDSYEQAGYWYYILNKNFGFSSFRSKELEVIK